MKEAFSKRVLTMKAKTDEHTLYLVLAADDNYARPMAVTIASALHNLDSEWSATLYLLSDNISLTKRRRIENVVAVSPTEASLEWIDLDVEVLSHAPYKDRLSRTVYAPLWIPELLPDRCRKAIFLDCDLLVRESLSNLWRRPMKDKPLIAARDLWIPHLSSKNGVSNDAEPGLAPDAPYFNSGVLIYNVEKWRQHDLQSKCAEYLFNNRDGIGMEDQEVMNAVLANDWSPLPLSWNVHHHIGTNGWKERVKEWPDSSFKRTVRSEYKQLLSDAKILHFAGPAKPWNIDRHHHKEAPQWFHYLWTSGYLHTGERITSRLHFYIRHYIQHFLKVAGDLVLLMGHRSTEWISDIVTDKPEEKSNP